MYVEDYALTFDDELIARWDNIPENVQWGGTHAFIYRGEVLFEVYIPWRSDNEILIGPEGDGYAVGYYGAERDTVIKYNSESFNIRTAVQDYIRKRVPQLQYLDGICT